MNESCKVLYVSSHSYTVEWHLLSEFKMFRLIILIAMSSSRGSCKIKHELKQKQKYHS